LLRIGEFSKLSKTTIKTIRYYDKVGLLKPAFVDSSTSYRYYTEDQLETMRCIIAYKETGMSNDDIIRILGGYDSVKVLYELRRQLESNIKQMNRQIDNIDRMLTNSCVQQYTAELKNIDSYTVYCCHGYIATLSHIHSFIRFCYTELRRTNPDVKYSLPDYCCVIYPGDSYRETNIYIEYAQSVDRIGNDTHAIKFKTLEPVMAVSVKHRGGYENLRDAYLYGIKWAAENGFSVCGDIRECYIDGTWNKESKDEWLTEVQIPVKEDLTQ